MAKMSKRNQGITGVINPMRAFGSKKTPEAPAEKQMVTEVEETEDLKRRRLALQGQTILSQAAGFGG